MTEINQTKAVEDNMFPARGRGIYLLPNLFTISALFAGFYAIISALKAQYDLAAIAVFIAMVMDSLDGRVARLTNTQTHFGAELDSLSDMVCFGVAPALMIYSWSLMDLGKFGWLASFAYTACVALRLARFNSRPNTDKRFFQGLACPAAAGMLAGLIWVANTYEFSGIKLCILVAIVTLTLGLLMISRIPYRSFKDTNLKDSVPFMTLVLMVLILISIALDPPFVLFFVFFAYVVSGPTLRLWSIIHKRFQKT